MVPSKARAYVRALVREGALPSLPADLDPSVLLGAAREQGLVTRLAAAVERERPAWGEGLEPTLAAERRTLLVRTLAQVALAARASALLAERGIRTLPLKGAVLAESVYAHEAERPMSDVDLLALERFPDAVDALGAAGFEELARGDHAWAFRDGAGGGIVELHRSVVSAPGLFPLDAEGLWQRRRAGRGQLPAWPSAEDLLIQLALHAAFQHGLVLTLVQWLDFRLLLEREPLELERVVALADAARARVPLAAALAVAAAVVGAPAPRELGFGLPRALERRLQAGLADPLSFVAPAEPDLARVRLELLSGRRAELLWRTLVLPETPGGDTRLGPRLRLALRRAWRFARGRGKAPSGNALVHDLGEPKLPAGAGVEVPFGEELLRDCLAAFPHVRLTVTGRCMEPAIGHGEKVQLVSASRRRPWIGDVVLARQKDGLRLHRLVFGPPIAPPGSYWRTRADRGGLLDPPLAAADVLASIVSVEGQPRSRPRRVSRALASLVGTALPRAGTSP
jgi:hypothetical protein